VDPLAGVGAHAPDGSPGCGGVVTRVGVIGAGSWGTAVAGIAATNADVAVLWARRPELAAAITTGHENPDYLGGVDLPDRLRGTSDLEEACAGADAIVMGVPSHGLRAVLAELAPFVGPSVPVVSLIKGIEQESNRRASEIIAEELGREGGELVGVLTGPNLAREVAMGQPAASVVAFADDDVARDLQRLFMTGTLRVYTNPDVVGCEIAGAVKNVMAIAAGIAHGLGYGDNTMAALLTRGLAELARLGTSMGGHALTFGGLAGMGDLVATCTSDKSRNRTVGVELGRGRPLDEIVAEMHMVAEGVKSTRGVLELARTHGVEMPIADQVGAVLHEGRKPEEVVPALMTREAKAEAHGLLEARRRAQASPG
jgi:glycerol-3-phosphate dehydrogenase (NAD(P)+)